MSSHRTTVAAVIASLAFAAPVATANAATPTTPAPLVDSTVCGLFGVALSPYGPTSLFGGAGLADVLNHARTSVNCPAPTTPTTPTLPTLPTLSWKFPWS